MSQSSVHAQVRVFLFKKKKNQIRISLIYRKMICLNLTLVIHFFPKNIEGFEFLLLIFKVVPLSKLMTP